MIAAVRDLSEIVGAGRAELPTDSLGNGVYFTWNEVVDRRSIMNRKPAFTLVELMVVVAITALLLGVLMPALSSARRQAKRSACSANLRQVGIALRSYIGENKDRLPHVSFMPSIGPAPLSTSKPIRIVDVLKIQTGNDSRIFHCPQDEPSGVRPAPNEGKPYFESEGSSYEFRVQMGGSRLDEVAARIARFTDRTIAENSLWVMRDYDNFHGKPGSQGARRYLYIDGHVTDFEN